MMEINFNAGSDPDAHQCESYREGDWIVFKCTLCPTYERRVNWKTGQMIAPKEYNKEIGQLVELGIKEDIRHVGNHVPADFKPAFQNLN